MERNKFIQLVIICLASIPASLFAQAPTDNPYRTVYNPQFGHWTDSLNWNQTLDVTTLGAVADDQQDDYLAISAGIQQLAALPRGGVLYFPPGMYICNESITLPPKVILRGANPVQGQNDPKLNTFNPPSKIWFPKYVFDTLANNGAGVDNSTAFKLIQSTPECDNAGLVYLHINRASIKFQPTYTSQSGFSTLQPSTVQRNMIVFGVASHNAVVPGPEVPAADQKPWQRFPWRFSANIDIVVKENALVAHCRLNDKTMVASDNFMMDGYLIRQRNTTNMRLLTQADGENPVFDYDGHYAICVNRKKTYINQNGRWSVEAYVGYAGPETEPTLFARNIEILDNWMYKSNRVAIIAAGIGLAIKNNVMKDDSTKPNRPDFFGPVGTVTPQGATTFENRGIDFSGWKAVIEGNDVEAFRHQAGGYLSTDGEGILVQECCGGTSVNDYTIRNNYMRKGNYIGIYKMRDCHNVNINNNFLGGGPVWLWANTNGGTYALHNCHVSGNTELSGINLNGDVIGTNTTVSDNVGRGTSGLSYPCYTVATNNTGFNLPNINNNGGAACLPNTNFPAISFFRPFEDSSFCDTTIHSKTLVGKVMAGNWAAMNVQLYAGNTIIASNLTIDAFDSTVRHTINIPTVNGSYSYTFMIRQGNDIAYSYTRTITRNCQVIIPSAIQKPVWQNLEFFPNPASRSLTIVGQDKPERVVITNPVGQRLFEGAVDAENNKLQLNLPSGLYQIRIGNRLGKLVIE